tara:strand:- start:170 stop:2269 length:2100 start_codon:yes stop_codon:yes gene_type:complete
MSAARRYLISGKLSKDLLNPGKNLIDMNPSSAKSASALDIGRISLAEDSEARIRAFAEARGIEPERYVIRKGTISYRGDDGVMYREIPKADFSDPMSIFKNIMSGIGDAISEGPKYGAGIVTAPMMLGGPKGVALSMGITGGVAAGAQATREFLAEQLVGPQKDTSYRMIKKPLVGALEQGSGGALAGKVEGLAAKDLARLPQIKGAISSLEKKASELGIHLTPAELTNLSSLKAQQKMLSNLPQSSETMVKFMRNRAEKIASRVTKYFERFSPEDSSEVAGMNIRDAAKAAIKTAEKARDQAASPLYERAWREGGKVDVSAAISYVDDELLNAKGGIAKALRSAKSLLFREIQTVVDGKMITKIIPDDRILPLHNAKLALDDIIDIDPGSKIGPTATRKLMELKDILLAAMDDASPAYSIARESFAVGSRPIDVLKDGIIGIIANIKDANVQSAAAKLFDAGKIGPRAVSEARRILAMAAPREWQAVKRSWLQSQWEVAGKEIVSAELPMINQGPKFKNLLLGDANRRRVIKAALFGDEYKALVDFADVMEAAGRVKPIGSDTAWNQEMMKIARNEATPRLAKYARWLNFTQYGTLIENYFTERGLAKNAEKVAQIVTTPGASRKIHELLKAKPGSARFAVALVDLLSAGGQGKGLPLIPGRSTESVNRYGKMPPKAIDNRPSPPKFNRRRRGPQLTQ